MTQKTPALRDADSLLPENHRMGQEATSFHRVKYKDQARDKKKIPDWLGPLKANLVWDEMSQSWFVVWGLLTT